MTFTKKQIVMLLAMMFASNVLNYIGHKRDMHNQEVRLHALYKKTIKESLDRHLKLIKEQSLSK